MTTTSRRLLLRANAAFLLIAATAGFATDVAGAFFARGPVGTLLGQTPHATIGFIEAHGLAFIVGVLLLRAEPMRAWHLTAAAVHVLLGTSNLVFWQIFVASDMLWGGYLTTSLHGLFAVLQFAAAWIVIPARATAAPPARPPGCR